MTSRDPQKVNVVTQITLNLNISKTVRNGWIATKLAHDGHTWACIHDMLKVKVKGHVIQTRL